MSSSRTIALALAAAMMVAAPACLAQEAVTPAPDVDALFKSNQPQLNRNLQSTYHIMKDLLEAGHWELAPAYLTQRYIQHNPNVPSGRDAVVGFFKAICAKPKPISARLAAPVVKVIAQGDTVVVITVATLPDPRKPGKTYTTSWFDMWRFVDGKADEHWDSATVMMPGPKPDAG